MILNLYYKYNIIGIIVISTFFIFIICVIISTYRVKEYFGPDLLSMGLPNCYTVPTIHTNLLLYKGGNQ